MDRLQIPPLLLWKKQARQQKAALRAQRCYQPSDRGARRAIQKAEGQHSLQNFLNANVENAIKFLSHAAEWVKKLIITSDRVLQHFKQLDGALQVTEPQKGRNQGSGVCDQTYALLEVLMSS